MCVCVCACACVQAGFAHITLVSQTPGFTVMANEGTIIHVREGSMGGVPACVDDVIQLHRIQGRRLCAGSPSAQTGARAGSV